MEEALVSRDEGKRRKVQKTRLPAKKRLMLLDGGIYWEHLRMDIDTLGPDF